MNCWILSEKDGCLTGIAFTDDPLKMNWIRENGLWGKVTAPAGLHCSVEREILPDGRLEEVYCFCNQTEYDIYCPEGSVAIEVPLNDSYLDAEICLSQRCHAHVWCGGGMSFIMALRMGGESPHLGLVLKEGALGSYSIRRSLTESHCVSNTRGTFLLHPEAFRLGPGDVLRVRWQLFRHEGREDFLRIIKKEPDFRYIESDQWVAFRGEEVRWSEGLLDTSVTGEIRKEIVIAGRTAKACWRVIPDRMTLLKNRARFIVIRQQCRIPDSKLDGAYLIYDNETGLQYYSHEKHDHNGARERVGMGVLVALYLQYFKDPEAENSLKRYTEYLLREVYDESHHTVCNDAGYSLNWHRLYNYAWMAVYFTELYILYGEAIWIERAADVMESYYRNGGEEFYAIGIPMTAMVKMLIRAGKTERAERMRGLFLGHAYRIAATGKCYPTSEVDYEQSIVAPAVHIMLMGYQLSGDETLLSAAKSQLCLLELFNGVQPDYHLYEVAIRHWDGHWFGKSRLLGDTFPHYWSSLSGIAFDCYGRITGEKEWMLRAEKNLRGSLPLFFEDGSASCAMIYPRSVNGTTAGFFDPWANDQDWGLYYYFRRGEDFRPDS